MLSFWEKNTFTQYDYIVIGGGIVGFSTAYHLLKSDPKANLLLLERGLLPTGASTRNAGFACFGSLTELISDLQSLTTDEMLALVTKRFEGLKALRSILGDEAIGFLNQGGYELIRDKELPALEQLDAINDLLKPYFKEEVFSANEKLIDQFGFSKNGIHTIIRNKFEGQVDTGKMMKSWWQLLNSMGGQIMTGAEALKLSQENDRVIVSVKDPFRKDNFHLSAKKVVICTNAFAKKFIPDADITPGRGIVLATKPIENFHIKGTFHYDEGFFYFRDFGKRLLLGGGRNLAFEEETTDEFTINQKILSTLKSNISEFILPHQPIEIEQSWSGIMAFGKTKEPIIKKVGDRIAIGVRMGGMGVAIGTLVGQQLQELLSN
jgi:glycine/D-amino acid oxidase-like deaminating enzyme